MKRILLTNSPTSFLHQGGGEQEIRLLAEALNMAGMIADIYGPFSNSVHSYQFGIHFSLISESESIINSLNQTGLHLILWPNLWFINEPSLNHLKQLSSLLKNFKAIVFRSKAEENHFRKYFDLSGIDIIKVPSLIHPRFKQKNFSNVFIESYGFNNYAIWPGIIEPQKNQLSAVLAFNQLEMDLVISGAVRDKAYFEECTRSAKENIHFIPSMPFVSDIHLSALLNSALFVELPLDFPGTSAMEAAEMGCCLLLSQSEWTEEMLGDRCIQVDPLNIDEIISKVLQIRSTPLRNLDSESVSLIDQIKPLVKYICSYYRFSGS